MTKEYRDAAYSDHIEKLARLDHIVKIDDENIYLKTDNPEFWDDETNECSASIPGTVRITHGLNSNNRQLAEKVIKQIEATGLLEEKPLRRRYYETQRIYFMRHLTSLILSKVDEYDLKFYLEATENPDRPF